MAVPSFVIAIIVILVILSISTSVHFIFRKKRSSKPVGTSIEHQDEEEYITEKNSYAIKPLTPYNQLNNNSTLKGSQASTTSTIPTSPATAGMSSPSFEKVIEYGQPAKANKRGQSQQQEQGDGDEAEEMEEDWRVPTTEFKINLPLPPPSSSFFSDKMELDSMEANDLYASYMNVAATQQQSADFVSIELSDIPFLSNIQQKAATLRKSIRRKSNIPKAALSQFFQNATNDNQSDFSLSTTPSTHSKPENTRMSRQSSSTSSRFPRSSLQNNMIPPSPRPDSSVVETSSFFGGKASNNSSKKSLLPAKEPNSNKIVIDDETHLSYFGLPIAATNTTNSPTPSTPSPLVNITMKPTIQQQQELLKKQQQQQQEDYKSIVQDINNSTDISVSDDDEEEGPNDKNEEIDAAQTARRLIRSASRKSRTRSTIVTEEAAQAMLNIIATNNPPPPSTTIESLQAPPAPQKTGTLRNHNIEIDTSLRKDDSNSFNIREWSSSNNSESPLFPSPKRAIMSSTLSGSNTVSGKKMAKQQLKNVMFNNSSDNLLPNESMTLGRKSGINLSGPRSLRNLFARPCIDSIEPTTAVIDDSSNKIIVEDDEMLQHLKQSENQDEEVDIISIKTSNTATSATPNTPYNVTTEESPILSKNNTLRKTGNNVDTIRRMLQSSWSGNNLKESGSTTSLSSSSDYMGSVGSSFRPIASPLGSMNPRLQNQHLVSLSLKANNVTQRPRPSMPSGFMDNEDGPVPTASFSSSTVRTMIPAEEEQQAEDCSRLKKAVMGNLRQPRQPSKLGDNNRKLGPLNTTTKKTPAQIEREKYLKSLDSSK